MEILRAVPDALLILKNRLMHDPSYLAQLRRDIAQCGVDPDRLRCYARSPTRELHLQTYNLVDVALDTFPFTGVTTTCEALWMGTPVVTLRGTHHMARREPSHQRRSASMDR